MAADKEKFPLSVVRKFPHKTLNRMLNKMREHLKHDETVIKMFKEYGVDIEEIDLIPMRFGNIDVSATTNHGVITFNYRLLCDGFKNNYSYGAHEVLHFLRRSAGDKPTQGADDGDYLSNPYEQEAFQNQVEYISKHKGEEEAEKYVDDLLEHHDVDDEKEFSEKKEVLMAKATPAWYDKYR